ncbi:MAG: dTDP-glucose 4,6-dehydratase [Parcubacteria group bacterium GW2011_GWC2_39_14]|nr:MAG: dTDP-glucose 4,6-dehydratase [Parcubacteria group bacterium GW2011_GWC2_39_14]KKR55530.1 MAG: dTDP-glucose 4,6-dehydratase [Parcubacteria group bacterium GW2011_GWA2_40_23]
MKMLVTGGAGFIGSNFIHYILNKYPDYDVINFDKLTYAGNLENLKELEDHPNYHFVKGDILNSELLEHVAKDVDIIVHFAAESHVDRSVLDPFAFIRTNVLGTHTLLEVARKLGNKRFHHVSTDEVFGSLSLEEPDKAFHEESPYDPRSPYSSSKAASDHLVRAYYHTFGLPITISNCSNNYGPYHFPEKVIPLFITNLMEGKKVPLYGDGKNVRDWIHVLDHCSAIDVIIHKGKIGHTYVVGGNSEKSNFELTMAILENMGMGEEMIDYVKDRPGHDRRYAIRPHKIKAELGWQPTIGFDDGIRRTIQWYAEHEAWWQGVKTGDYLKYYDTWYNKH